MTNSKTVNKNILTFKFIFKIVAKLENNLSTFTGSAKLRCGELIIQLSQALENKVNCFDKYTIDTINTLCLISSKLRIEIITKEINLDLPKIDLTKSSYTVRKFKVNGYIAVELIYNANEYHLNYDKYTDGRRYHLDSFDNKESALNEYFNTLTVYKSELKLNGGNDIKTNYYLSKAIDKICYLNSIR